MTEAIVKTVTVPVTPARAFTRFTNEIMGWWPIDKHSVSAGAGKIPQKVVIEPGLGGAVYEIKHDGERCEWGQVTKWSEPDGFTMTWHPGQSMDTATQLTMRFDAATDGTLVTLTHSGWAALAERAADMRAHYSSGWDHVLADCYAGRL
ncbi:SRPBCC family protein [Cognatishimia sp. WU-CL00825]|uniref:SRPBCC domain-containing protein n=1 Tax=Cognatishimia sp. WU-CL00825 TaxID=3127658 RepID=UPI0031021D2C